MNIDKKLSGKNIVINYLKHNEIDKEKWDKCIAQSLNGIVYAYSWYLDVVCNGWEALIEGEYEAVMPLTAKKKYGIHYLFQPYFAQQLGVFSKSKFSKDTVKKFIKKIPEKYKFIEINLNTLNTVEAYNDMPLSCKKNSNYELDLSNNYKNIYTKYSENTRRNIKKAIKNEVNIKKDAGISKIITIFKQNKGKNFPHLKNDFYELLANLMTVCINRGNAEVWGVQTKENELCGGVFFVEANKRTIFLFSGITSEGKSVGAMPFLIDRFIFERAGENAIFDFEGSNNPDLARFYKSFGAEEKMYLQIQWNRLPWYIKWLKAKKINL